MVAHHAPDHSFVPSECTFESCFWPGRLTLVFEASAAVIYGLLWDNPAFAKGGAAALGAIVVFGVVVFTARALLNEVRMRRALAVAQAVPNAIAAIPDFSSSTPITAVGTVPHSSSKIIYLLSGSLFQETLCYSIMVYHTHL